MFYFFDTTDFNGNPQRHILQRLDDGGVRSFPLVDDNPNKLIYDAWLAEGNTSEEWKDETV